MAEEDLYLGSWVHWAFRTAVEYYFRIKKVILIYYCIIVSNVLGDKICLGFF